MDVGEDEKDREREGETVWEEELYKITKETLCLFEHSSLPELMIGNKIFTAQNLAVATFIQRRGSCLSV